MDAKAECKSVLEFFQTEIQLHAMWVYAMPYRRLPQNAQRAIRADAREVAENKIWELTHA
jgi:hypothetical protein